ncbi:hypothetical protein SASPL_117024 [Salvia splendens]|uniref:Uncharacterized protein n=1 Tax=Salvia splendens TaxID=180675 RepID=A0A8X8ZXD7_SALSN|nr:hypothetical protein SASPL_117024 [Salvia splendens]
MGTRTGSHQLSSGLMVSGRPERQPTERPSRMASRTVIYTGGDIKTSGELGRMYGVDISGGENPPQIPPRPPGVAAARSGPIQATPGSNRRSEPLDAAAASTPCSFKKANYSSAVTSLGGQVKLGFRISLVAMWVSLAVTVIGLTVVALLIAAVEKMGVLGFLRKFPDSELRNAVDGQFVKVTGLFGNMCWFKLCLLLLVAVHRLKLRIKECQDVCMFPLSYTNIEVMVEKRQMLSTVSSVGDAGTQRLVFIEYGEF